MNTAEPMTIDWGPLAAARSTTRVPTGDGKAAWKDNAYVSFWDPAQRAFGTLHVSTSPNAEGRRARVSLSVDGTVVEVDRGARRRPPTESDVDRVRPRRSHDRRPSRPAARRAR